MTTFIIYPFSLQGSEKDKKKELAEKEERAKKVLFMCSLQLVFLLSIYLGLLLAYQ